MKIRARRIGYHRAVRFPSLGVFFLALCGMAAPVHAARILRVHGAARIDGHAGRSHGRVLVEGRVLDDAGSPVPSESLAVALAPPADPAIVTACGDDHPLAALRTDESGRFCFWIPAPVIGAAYRVNVTAAATQWLAAGTAKYAVDLSKRSVQLRFDPEPRIVAIDGAETSLDVVATSDDDDHAGASSLLLTLVTERGAVLAHATTGAGGRATFAFNAHDLGEPGRGALVVRFDGDEITMPSEHIAPIERDARVTLTLAKNVEPSAPEDGVDVDVIAQLAHGGVVPSGTVEARLAEAAGGAMLVGAAPLSGGRATIHATFVPPRGAKTVALQIRYVPDAPWLQPTADLTASVPIRGPSPLRQVPLAIGAIAIGAWLLLGRNARRHRLDRTVVMTRPPSHEGTAGIAVVHSSRSRTGVYRGRVVDAHDGGPVARARISVQMPSFAAAPPVASVFANDEGEFSLELEVAPQDAELVVEAPLHADLRQKLPGAGVLEIALVSRRRKLLERLVQWAKRRGPPFDVRPEPTPAQVRRAAEGSMPAAVPWAEAIEQAAFDRGDVDARVEAEVTALEPAPGAPPPRR
ncbi:MAG TPA: hypothetical protein VGH28_06555 [Polyangiaceae bacterium]|jgi:hypothetical protein